MVKGERNFIYVYSAAIWFCYVFTKLLRPLVKRWRSYGFRAIIYIDDGICGANSYRECEPAKKVMLEDLASAGFVTNYTKSQLVPQQTGRWLGFLLLQVPADKIKKLQEVIACVNLEGAVSAQLLANIVGEIIYMGLARTSLLTRYMYELLIVVFHGGMSFTFLKMQRRSSCFGKVESPITIASPSCLVQVPQGWLTLMQVIQVLWGMWWNWGGRWCGGSGQRMRPN